MEGNILSSTLVTLFQSLSLAARRNLRKWMQSPLHSPTPEAIQLIDFLDKKRTLSSTSLSKQRVYTHLFPGQSYQDNKLRQVMHEALKCLEEFVGFFTLQQDAFGPIFFQVKGLETHGHSQRAQRHLSRLHNHIHTQTERSYTFHQQAFELEQLQFELMGTQQRTAENNLPQLFTHLSAHFVLTTLRYACVAASHRSVSRQEYEIPLLSAIFSEIEAGTWAAHPTIDLYAQAYLTLTEPNLSRIQALKSTFSTHRSLLSSPEQQDVLLIALNACIRQLNTDDERYAQEAFALYQLGLNTEILLENGTLSRFNYKNIVSIALKVKAYDWAETFITDYAETLAPTHRESYQTFNLARLNFARGNYSATKQLLSQVEYDDVFFNLGAKMMMLKVYYETRDIEALEALLQSFDRYLKRQSGLGYHREVYDNFLSLVRQLLRLPPQDEMAREKLRIRIMETQPLAERGWLLGQIVE